jgi:hypothetical protein
MVSYLMQVLVEPGLCVSGTTCTALKWKELARLDQEEHRQKSRLVSPDREELLGG